jgi:hypothetical protein
VFPRSRYVSRTRTSGGSSKATTLEAQPIAEVSKRRLGVCDRHGDVIETPDHLLSPVSNAQLVGDDALDSG